MIADPLLRWVVTGLFVLAAAQGVYAIAADRGRTPARAASAGTHIAMCLVMALMAWPGVDVPVVPAMIGFGLATAWFLVQWARPRAADAAPTCALPSHTRAADAYHAVMMAAMAWMAALMAPGLLPGAQQDVALASGPGLHAHGGGHDVGHEVHDAAGYASWVTTLTWAAVAGFTVAAGFWLWRYFADRRAAGSGLLPHSGTLAQAAMAAGTAAMFAAAV